jgi:hypothetical protein
MRRVVSSVLVAILVSLVLSVVPVQAQSQLADIRSQLNGLLVQLRTIDNTCVVILGGLINEFDKDILHARKLITTGKGNLNRLLIETLRSAINTFSIILDFAQQCSVLLSGLNSSAQEIVQEITPLLGIVTTGEPGLNKSAVPAVSIPCVTTVSGSAQTLAPTATSTTIDPRKACRIVQLGIDAFGRGNLMATSFFTFTVPFVSQAASLNSSVLEDLENIFETGECVTGDSDAVRVQPALTESGPICFQQLREFKERLGLAHSQIKLAQQAGLREFVRNKKWLLKAIREIKELLRASNFGGRGASELLNISASTTRIYTLNGQLISIQTENSLSTQNLPNGAYLLIKESRDSAGQIHRQVEKLVVAR